MTDVLEEDLLKALKEEEAAQEDDQSPGQELKLLTEFEKKLPLNKNHLQSVFQNFFAATTSAQAKEFAALIVEVFIIHLFTEFNQFINYFRIFSSSNLRRRQW